MASKTRERRIIESVACPQCGAALGELCRRPPGTHVGRLFVCQGRRAAWQMVKDSVEREAR